MPVRRKRKATRKRRLPGSRMAGGTASSALKRRTNKREDGPLSGGVVEIDDSTVMTSRVAGHPIPNAFREGEYLHVSDLLGKCTRMIALSDQTGTPIAGESLWDNMLVTFAIGNAIHDYVRSKVARTSPEEMYGTWKCVCGHHEYKGTYSDAKRKAPCSKCGKDLTEYHELVLRNDYYMIVGSVDLTLLFARAFYFCEIKSIKKEDWDEITRPIPLHILQIVFYWWLATELGLPVHKQVSVLYVTKGHVFGSPYKEFVIDPTEHLHRLTEYLEDALALKKAKKRKGVLPVRLCPKTDSPQAKKCEMNSLCFGIKT